MKIKQTELPVIVPPDYPFTNGDTALRFRRFSALRIMEAHTA